MTEPTFKTLEAEAQAFPRYDPKYWHCPSCNQGATALIPLSGAWWAVCDFCGLRAALPDVPFVPLPLGPEDFEPLFLYVASHDDSPCLSVGLPLSDPSLIKGVLRMATETEKPDDPLYDARFPLQNAALRAHRDKLALEAAAVRADAARLAPAPTAEELALWKHALSDEPAQLHQLRERLAKWFAEHDTVWWFCVRGRGEMSGREAARRLREGDEYGPYYGAQHSAVHHKDRRR
jgi:hypothetical protein